LKTALADWRKSGVALGCPTTLGSCPRSHLAYVAYTVPVIVEVDLSRHSVERVVVIDEEVALDDEAAVSQDEKAAAQKIAIAAIEIAENLDGCWPAWEFGF
jgi:hypothetical protein